jgi:hypothetical protein
MDSHQLFLNCRHGKELKLQRFEYNKKVKKEKEKKKKEKRQRQAAEEETVIWTQKIKF